MTPDEVKKYMMRKYQDPAEVLSSQLLEYLISKLNVKDKFETAFKHGLLVGKEIAYVGIFNNEPTVWIINPVDFNYDRSPNSPFIEDSEFATTEFRLPPSVVVQLFNEELNDEQIDKIYQSSNSESFDRFDGIVNTEDGVFSQNKYNVYNSNFCKVYHVVWKSLRKIGFLTYLDPNGELQTSLVDEHYEMMEEGGDLDIEWKWIPEVYETWKINDMYIRMRALEGQHKDLDNLYTCKLPYYGVVYDNINSEPVSLMDRLKSYQYLFNIIIFRMEMLLYSDKGKKLMMNINAVPNSAGMDVKKWQYFFETNGIIWYNPEEEGVNYQDVNTMAKEIDLSLVSQIRNYMEFAEYIRTLAGRSVGITDQIEGQIAEREAVTNAKQSIIQSSNIIEPLFSYHSLFKRNILQALIETAKIAYRNSDKMKLTYILDDLSQKTLQIDSMLLDNSTFGLFVSDSIKNEETKETIRQLALAAIQNGQASLSDILNVLRVDNMVEASEMIKLAELKREEREDAQSKAEQEQQERQREFLIQQRREEHEMDIELTIVKEEERRKTAIIEKSLLGASFNPDVDENNNRIPDFLEIAKTQIDEVNKKSRLDLDERKFAHQQKIDKERVENEKEKLKIQKNNKK